MDILKLRYLIREAIENIANISSKFSVGDIVTTKDRDKATVTMAEHPFYTVELESTGTTKSFSFTELAPYEEKIIAKTSEGISLKEGVNASPGLLFHQTHKISLSECVFRIGSNAYVDFFTEARKLLCSSARPEEMEDIYKWMYDNIDLFGSNSDEQDEAVLVIKQGLVDHSFVAEAEINLSATLIKLARIRNS